MIGSWIARKKVASLAACLAISFLVGCKNGAITGRMYQSQQETDRLLSEFRAQKKENEQLREDRNKLLQQQAETEKLAARLQAQLNSNRPMASRKSSGVLGGNPSSLFNSTQQSTVSSRSKPVDGSGLRNLDLPNSFRNSQEIQNDEMRSASNSDSLQWRPIRKATR